MEELRPIWNLIKELKPDISQIPVMLVGNKCDESAELREMTASEGQAEAAAWGGVSFMETSAKTNHNVTELFQVGRRQAVVIDVLRQWQQNPLSDERLNNGLVSFPGTAQHGEEQERLLAAGRQERQEGQVEKGVESRRRRRGQQWGEGEVPGHVKR